MDAASFVGTEPLADDGRIDRAKLAAFLRGSIPGVSGEMTLARFRGGQSNPTFLVSFANGRRLVLRKKPDGVLLPSAHAVDREFRVIRALQDSPVPVAKAHLLSDDESLVGAMFYVMDFVEGRSFWDPSLPEQTPAERGAIFGEMARVIAALHALDYAALGLSDFGKPGGYFARQVARWSKQYRASETEAIAAMDRLIEWLPANLPAEQASALLHGDFRLDNMIFHPTEPCVLAVLDWELSTLGDPVADFAYHTLTWHLPARPFRGLADRDLSALGIPAEPAYRHAYFATSGRPQPDERIWNAYLAYSLFRVAAIRQGIMKRVVDGTAANAHAGEAGALARPVAELALAFAERADTM
jgi:aminoglycoside phosphotransferase (APT) family kinase protein